MNYIQLLNLAHLLILGGTVITLLIFQLKGRLTNRHVKALVLFVAVYLFVFAFAKSVLQWHVWSLDPLSRNLLPPQNPDYFYWYAFNRFFLFSLVTALAAALFLGMMFFLRYQFGRSTISVQEMWLAALAALLLGFPKIILFVVTIFLFMFVGIFLKKTFPIRESLLDQTKMVRISYLFRSRFFLEEKPFTSSLVMAFLTLLVFGNPLVIIFGLHVMKV